MATDLMVLETELAPLTPRFQEVLAGVMPVERLIRTAMIAIENNPKLLNCNRQSLFNSIMTAGVLGLEMDGVTGQAFLIPFKNKIQLVIGYKGFSTLGARAGLTITGDVVREGDEFDWEKGTSPFVKHKEGKKRGDVTYAWAVAAALNRPPIVEVLSIDDILEIKKRSPGARSGESPWNDPTIGFPAMASKSAKRRLCRSTPLNVMQLAARMDEAFEEQGKLSYIRPADRALIIENDESPIAPREQNETPTIEEITQPAAAISEAKSPPADPLETLKTDGRKAAERGMTELRRWWDELHPHDTHQLTNYLDTILKPIAKKVDAAPAA